MAHQPLMKGAEKYHYIYQIISNIDDGESKALRETNNDQVRQATN